MLLSKLIIVVLILLLLFTSNAFLRATNLPTTSESHMKAFDSDGVVVDVGAISSGSYSLMKYDDQQSLIIATNNDGEASLVINFPINDFDYNIRASKFILGVKTSLNGTVLVSIYNGATYDSLGSISSQTTYASNQINISDISSYIINNMVKIKLVIDLGQLASLYLDQAMIQMEYSETGLDAFVQDYSITKANVETGNATTNATALKYRDNSLYSVTSVTNKVAWNNTLTLR